MRTSGVCMQTSGVARGRLGGHADAARRHGSEEVGDLIPEQAPVTPGGEQPEPARPPAIRASDQDRDAVAQRLQQAFAERRLDDDEFDERMRAALTAKTSADLDRLTSDLPAVSAGSAPAVPAATPGRWAVAYKNSVRRGGRWRVPERFNVMIYKGQGWLDLRAAELTAPVTTVVAVAYKSRVDILVPPGVRVEMGGFGVSKGWSAEEELETRLPPGAPTVHVRGTAYKGTIEARTKPQELHQAPGADEG
jgi:hypothetical protein